MTTTMRRKHQAPRAPVVIWAVLTMLVGLPIAVATGIQVHDSRSRFYTEQAQASNSVTAVVTSEKAIHQELADPSTVSVPARWFASGAEHAGAITAPRGAKVGDSVEIRVDAEGYHIAPPARTVLDESVAAALSTWVGVGIVAALCVAVVRSFVMPVPATGRQLHVGSCRDIGHRGAPSRLAM